ncbi:MAG TPA: type II toxin-antitoxin system ParD family antitoxin [Asticcacaulis sp.]|nr:type II toxin-antitoxin system ParD family antitoxin [Asticcacaulis sp.]
MPSSYALGAHFESLMDDLIRSGRYNSKSEILRDGLRVIEERESRREAELDALKKALAEGMNSGPSIPADKVFDELKARYQTMIDTAAGQ